MQYQELLLFFFAVALVYASVGFGGGSSYLALLALYPIPFPEIKLTALSCNIIVVTGGTLLFIKHRQVDWKKTLPLVAASVPMAFAGARLKLSQEVFFIILGCSLIAAALLLWVKTRRPDNDGYNEASQYGKSLLLGSAIGFLSGMVGIGGGIFLSPLLNLAKWDTPRRIAATASLFILVNSVSGIAGQLSTAPGDINIRRIGLLCVAVLVGGQIGSRMAAAKFNMLVIKRVTAVLVFAAGVEVLCKHLPWFK
ncbi:MAG: sulfite exporter TauE/SafE family protein [Bacteroidota bacterium]